MKKLPKNPTPQAMAEYAYTLETFRFPEHFGFSELVRTDTGLPNVPGWKDILNLRLLARYLDRVRDEYGYPIKVNSGFRSAEVNAKVGGAKNSAHLEGLAADIVPAYITQKTMGNLLGVLERAVGQTVAIGNAQVAIDQLIVYCKTPKDLSSGIRFFHVGVAIDGNPRRQVLWK